MSKTNASGGSVRFLAEAGLIAALYAALTYLSGLLGLAYGPVQFRFSELLTLLPILSGAAVPGLTLGCLIANIGSTLGPIDMAVGSVATLLAAVATRLCRKIRIGRCPLLSACFPVLFNSLIIGAEITFLMPEGFTLAAFWGAALWIAVGEAVMCLALGLPLFCLLEKRLTRGGSELPHDFR